MCKAVMTIKTIENYTRVEKGAIMSLLINTRPRGAKV